MEKALKEEVEGFLEGIITDEEFAYAMEYGIRRQRIIYDLEKREEVLDKDYLVRLISEHVLIQRLSDLTVTICKTVYNMEKEHLFSKEQGAPRSTPIVTGLAE